MKHATQAVPVNSAGVASQLRTRDVVRPRDLTVAHRINAERIMLFAWGRAILLQLAHPLIAAGVYDHSGFRSTPLSAIARLHHTISAMLALTFGNDAEREHAFEGIRAIHRRVHGDLPAGVGPFPAGTRYSAEDPDLVLWVHVTLIESALLTYELLVGRLDDRDRNEYCEQVASVPIDLGARERDVPRTVAALHDCSRRMHASGMLVVSPQARELGHALMSPRFAWLVAPAAWANRLFTVGLLPASIRRQYGFEWEPRRERTLRRAVLALRTIRRLTPTAVAWWPEARI